MDIQLDRSQNETLVDVTGMIRLLNQSSGESKSIGALTDNI